MGYWGRRYVPVGEQRAKAMKALERLQKKGIAIQPVALEGRTIARSFWGKGWCSHIESFSDYSNRLPRGTRYVRNGSVCHLDIQAGQIRALVSGSRLYNVNIQIKPLSQDAWKAIKAKCVGQIGSMLELLQGRFSDRVMEIVADRETGLFPLPGEIKLQCDCPDWAVMCKHVAATLYGVGNRLDQRPDLLFLLRGVDPEELISADFQAPMAGQDVAEDGLEADALSAIFGIDLDTTDVAIAQTAGDNGEAAPGESPSRKASATKSGKQAGKESAPRKAAKVVAKKAAKSVATSAAKKTATKATAKAAKPSGARTKRSTARPEKGGARAASPPVTMPKSPTEDSGVDFSKPFTVTGVTGQMVAALRKKGGWSVPAMARISGLSAVTIYKWEKTEGPLRLQKNSVIALDHLRRQAKSQ